MMLNLQLKLTNCEMKDTGHFYPFDLHMDLYNWWSSFSQLVDCLAIMHGKNVNVVQSAEKSFRWILSYLPLLQVKLTSTVLYTPFSGLDLALWSQGPQKAQFVWFIFFLS